MARDKNTADYKDINVKESEKSEIFIRTTN